ncbi:MAG: hypothetical protein ACHQ49_00275 [Elusimicrobiota bacterium]
MTMRTAHLVSLGIWLGIVATEAVIELLPRRQPDLLPCTARMHFWIDLCVESPALIAVLATGLCLAFAAPMNARLALKVASGSAAVLANVICIALVIDRDKILHREDSAAGLRKRSGQIVVCAAAAIPFAVLSLFLGFGIL